MTEFNLKIRWLDDEAINVASRAERGIASKTCTIYAAKPYGLGDFKRMTILAEELLHCTDGEFHNPAPYRHIESTQTRLN